MPYVDQVSVKQGYLACCSDVKKHGYVAGGSNS